MSTIPSPLVADWIKRGLRWKYVFKDIRRSFSIPPNGEHQIGVFSKVEGLFLFGKFTFDRPHGGVRINAYPEWPIMLDIFTLYADGVNAPNVWGWVSRYNPDPYVGEPGIYAMVIPEGQVWQNRFELYVVNTSPTRTINCTRYLFAMAVLEEARSQKELEEFEAEGEN